MPALARIKLKLRVAKPSPGVVSATLCTVPRSTYLPGGLRILVGLLVSLSLCRLLPREFVQHDRETTRRRTDLALLAPRPRTILSVSRCSASVCSPLRKSTSPLQSAKSNIDVSDRIVNHRESTRRNKIFRENLSSKIKRTSTTRSTM